MMDLLVQISLRGLLFIVIGVALAHKMKDISAFQSIINTYAVVPSGMVPAAALLVIVFELLALALLMFGDAAIAGLYVAFLLSGYAVLIAMNIAQGNNSIDCGCSWIKSASLSPAYCYRNAVLAITALFLTVPANDRSLLALDFINAAFFAIATAGIYFLFDALLHMRSMGAVR